MIARDDDTTFGIRHSRFHEVWSLRLCTWLGVGNDPRYTPTTTFATFPFPERLTPDVPAANFADDPRAAAIAAAASAWSNCATAGSTRPHGRSGSTNPSPATPTTPSQSPPRQ